MTVEDASLKSNPQVAGSGSLEVKRFARLFADRTKVMKSSAMRDLMALTERPEVISLAGGLPDTTLFPAEDLAALLGDMARTSAARALQYAPTDGVADLQTCLADVMAAEQMSVQPNEILVTTGGQQVLDLACKTLINPGDVIVSEGPTYPGAVPTFSSYESNLVQIEMDDQGMRLDRLQERLDRLQSAGTQPKFIYTIPTFHNPAGITMSLARRKELLEIAKARQILILEDNPYALLRYEGEALPTLFALDGGKNVIYSGTLSKILSPGVRVGWCVAPAPIRQKMVIGKQGSDLNSSALAQLFVATYFQQRDWRDHVDRQIDVYRKRRDTMIEALEQHMPAGTTWVKPAGGLFMWVTLPAAIDTTDLLALALQNDVAFVPGRAAYQDGSGAHSMRLNFSGVREDKIREGIARIGKSVSQQLELFASLTGSHESIAAATTNSTPASNSQSTEATDQPGAVLPLRTAGRRRSGGA